MHVTTGLDPGTNMSSNTMINSRGIQGLNTGSSFPLMQPSNQQHNDHADLSLTGDPTVSTAPEDPVQVLMV